MKNNSMRVFASTMSIISGFVKNGLAPRKNSSWTIHSVLVDVLPLPIEYFGLNIKNLQTKSNQPTNVGWVFRHQGPSA